PSFLAALLEWAIEGYLRAFDAVEEDLDRVDVALMRAADDVLDETLGSLVDLRRRTGRLRRALSAHRRVLVALAHPELDAVSSEESAERFTSLVDRLDHAIGAAEAARDSVLGSFELIIARSGQRTNEIMKVLTLASVLLLPSSVLAGVMGMNFKVGVFEHPQVFWVVIGVMLLFAAAALAAARLRRWI
ncbi:MAG TPA: CorA family divalent cation transporter, partial [Gaiellaceae bacterium]|nr:CorA family divalent cation transporter [Gaiellaceae bacterium]